MTYIVGLTGGIASGKSTVANLFAEQKVAIIDADIIAREVILPGEIAYDAILSYFGPSILDAQHHIDRKKLQKIIFNDINKRLWLEQLLHPLIRQAMMDKTALAHSVYCLQIIPLLVETLPHPELNRILVIDVSLETQIERLKQRDQLTNDMIKNILKAQVDRHKRLQHADDIIDNDNDLSALTSQVLQLHQKYVQLAKSFQSQE